jgi:hypothetical protein
MYRQCVLHFVTPEGRRELVVWIEDKHALVGKTLELEKDDGSKEKGWMVKEVGNRKISKEEAQEMTRFYKDHRKGTDI